MPGYNDHDEEPREERPVIVFSYPLSARTLSSVITSSFTAAPVGSSAQMRTLRTSSTRSTSASTASKSPVGDRRWSRGRRSWRPRQVTLGVRRARARDDQPRRRVDRSLDDERQDTGRRRASDEQLPLALGPGLHIRPRALWRHQRRVYAGLSWRLTIRNSAWTHSWRMLRVSSVLDRLSHCLMETRCDWSTQTSQLQLTRLPSLALTTISSQVRWRTRVLLRFIIGMGHIGPEVDGVTVKSYDWDAGVSSKVTVPRASVRPIAAFLRSVPFPPSVGVGTGRGEEYRTYEFELVRTGDLDRRGDRWSGNTFQVEVFVWEERVHATRVVVTVGTEGPERQASRTYSGE